MEVPAEITFHNMRNSPALEADIRKRIAKLEKFYGRLIACRVAIEARSKHHRTGNIYDVHIEMQAPGRHLVVSREPHHVKERHARADVRASIIEAFAAAEAQLRSFGKRRSEKKKRGNGAQAAENTDDNSERAAAAARPVKPPAQNARL